MILLKIDLLALLLFSTESWMTLTLETETENLEHLYYVPIELYYFHRIVTFSVIVLEFIAYRSVSVFKSYILRPSNDNNNIFHLFTDEKGMEIWNVYFYIFMGNLFISTISFCLGSNLKE